MRLLTSGIVCNGEPSRAAKAYEARRVEAREY